MITVKWVRRGVIWDTVKFKANRNEFATFETLMGTKRFGMMKGQEVVLKQKKYRWDEGDEFTNLSAIITSWNQNHFAWKWID